MKRILRYIALSAAIICIQSCSKTNDPSSPVGDGEAILSLSADLPRGHRSSDQSGIANVDRTKFDLRFVFEIYDESGAFVKRMAINAGRQNTVNADFRLLAAKYTLLCWADFVTHDEANKNVADLYYDTDKGLKQVAVKQDAFIAMSNEAKAVYCTSVEVDLTSGNATLPGVTLRSPQAKLRLRTHVGDVESVSLTYSGLYQVYDVSTATATDLKLNVTTSCAFRTSSAELSLLCYDYIFSSAANDVRRLDISVKRTNEEQPVTKSVNNLELRAATLTTVTGDFLN